jgi:lipopolysaccharide export system protein LptC
VVIKQAPKTVITATGMVYDKKKQTLTLNKRVKAHYERPAGSISKTKPVATKPIAKALSAVSASTSKKNMVAKPNTTTKKKPLKKRKTLKKATRSKK